MAADFSPQPGLSVLVGPNGSGKTNVLRGIALLSEITAGNWRRYIEDDPFVSEASLKARFQSKDASLDLSSSVALTTDEKNHDRVIRSKNEWHSKELMEDEPPFSLDSLMENYRSGIMHLQDAKTSRIDLLRGILPNNLAEQYLQVERFTRTIEYFSASQYTNPSSSPISFEYTEQGGRPYIYEPGPKTKFLFDLFMLREENSNAFSEYLEIVGDFGMGLISDVSFERVQTSSMDLKIRTGGRPQHVKRTKNIVIPIFSVRNNNLSPNQLSEGTFKSLALTFYLLNTKKSLLLIEEPEVCVHRGLLSSIIELIIQCSDDRQVIVSTHSDYVLDRVPLESVFSVKVSEQEGTKVERITSSMDSKSLEALKIFLETEGTLGDYWKNVGFD